jgi:predicted nuclease of predicted toxin-antitoxin system
VKLQLDESLGETARIQLTAAGHDVSTVPLQGLQAALDGDLILQCKREGRALVTLDLDFANPLRYLPADFPGIAVLRFPGKPTARVLEALLRTLAGALEREPLSAQLWIVEVGRIRIHQDDERRLST